HLKQRHRPLEEGGPRFAVIAYGKLGGKELGYGSDLDVVFLYDEDDERAPAVYGACVRKLINWLTLRTAAGELCDIAPARRPRGRCTPRAASRAAPGAPRRAADTADARHAGRAARCGDGAVAGRV